VPIPPVVTRSVPASGLAIAGGGRAIPVASGGGFGSLPRRLWQVVLRAALGDPHQ
jgi:hypothetical protein